MVAHKASAAVVVETFHVALAVGRQFAQTDRWAKWVVLEEPAQPW